MKYIDTDYYPPAGCKYVSNAYLEELGMPIILCDKSKFSTELLVDVYRPMYFGKTLGGYVNHIVYEANDMLIVVYKYDDYLPRGQEADYAEVESRQQKLIEAKERGISEIKWELMTRYELKAWLNAEKERYHVGGN